jgi:predicted nucleic acid-binding protein
LDVLRLSQSSGRPADDCEFVALAEFLDIKFITGDAKLAKAFAARALLLYRLVPRSWLGLRALP